MARAIVQLLLDQDPAGDLVTMLGRPKPVPPKPPRTGRGFRLTEDIREFILSSECVDLKLDAIGKACEERFGVSLARGTVSNCLKKAGKSKRSPHKLKTAIRKFILESMGTAPAEVCASVKERWGTVIGTASVYKVWREKSKGEC